MRPPLLPTSVATVAALLTSCWFAEIELEGKTCPCDAPGYACDVATNTCKRDDAEVCAVVPTRFRVDWTTPETIRFAWTPPDDLSAFGSYRIVMGPTERAVRDGNEARTIGPEENAELGIPKLVRTGSGDKVSSSIVEGLAPATAYFAMLITTDNAGCEQASEVLEARTAYPAVADQIVFDPDPPPGAEAWPTDGSSTLEPCETTPGTCLVYTSATSTWENARIVFPALLGSASEMSQGDFETAFVEMRIATDSTLGPSWTELRIGFGSGIFLSTGIAIHADGAFHTYQIPLRAMATNEGTPLAHASTSGGVTELGVGALWPLGTRVRLTGGHVRW